MRNLVLISNITCWRGIQDWPCFFFPTGRKFPQLSQRSLEIGSQSRGNLERQGIGLWHKPTWFRNLVMLWTLLSWICMDVPPEFQLKRHAERLHVSTKRHQHLSLYPQGCLPITNPKDHKARMQHGLFKHGEYPIDFLFLKGHMMRPEDFGVPHFTLLATSPHLVVHRKTCWPCGSMGVMISRNHRILVSKTKYRLHGRFTGNQIVGKRFHFHMYNLGTT